MYNRIKKILTFVLITILSFFLNSNVYAASGYSNYDRYFFFSHGAADNAYTYFLRWGYVTNYPADTPFTKANVLSQIPSVTCFFASCHGSKTSIYAGYNGSEAISANEIDSASIGFYKFVFLDACWTGYDNTMASAFNIKDGDGLDHAYVGWTIAIRDNLNYALFNSSLFQNLDHGDNLIVSLLDAQAYSGCSSWIWYGKSTMTIR